MPVPDPNLKGNVRQWYRNADTKKNRGKVGEERAFDNPGDKSWNDVIERHNTERGEMAERHGNEYQELTKRHVDEMANAVGGFGEASGDNNTFDAGKVRTKRFLNDEDTRAGLANSKT